MIVLLLLAALCGVGYATRRRRRSAGAVPDERTAEDVEPLSGGNWSMVALNPQGRLHVVDLDDPTVDPATDVALPLRGHDIN